MRVLSGSGDLYAFKYDMRFPFVEWVAGEIEKAESNSWGGAYDMPVPIDNLRRHFQTVISQFQLRLQV